MRYILLATLLLVTACKNHPLDPTPLVCQAPNAPVVQGANPPPITVQACYRAGR